MLIQITLDSSVDEVTPFLAAIIGGNSAPVAVNPACSAAEEVIVTQRIKKAVEEAAVVAEVKPAEAAASNAAAPPKKRKRRTKAQIIADKRKEEEAIIAKAAAESVDDGDVTAEKVVEAPLDPPPGGGVTVEADAPVVPAVVNVEAVKSAVVNAISRLNKLPVDPLDENPKTATAVVVGVLEECTGKKRVGEIDPGVYGAVLAALNNVAV